MALQTFSIFYYGHKVDTTNQYLNFNEGSGELSAVVQIGNYTLTTLAAAIASSLNTFGTNTYSITVDRATRKLTITSDGTFIILGATGTQIGQTVLTLAGFDPVDTANLLSHEGDNASGKSYEPQRILQSYIDTEDFQRSIDPSISESADGTVEVVKFGIAKFIEFNIDFITNVAQSGCIDGAIKNNPTGVEDFRDFIRSLISKERFEFMRDIDDRDAFEVFILEKTSEDSKGTAYRLKELYNKGLVGYYDTGKLTMRLQ